MILAERPMSTHSSRWQKEKRLDSSANERKYTQIFKSKKYIIHRLVGRALPAFPVNIEYN